MGSRNLDATYCAEVVFDRMNVDVVGCFKIDSRILALLLILAICCRNQLSLHFPLCVHLKETLRIIFDFRKVRLGDQ